MHAKKKKYKAGLKSIYAAQTIVSELDETVERNLDYLIAVNSITGYLLIMIQRPQEAIEFLEIAERISARLLSPNPPQDQDGQVVGKRSRLSATLLSNYVLSITLMKNIARKFTDSQGFNDDFDQLIQGIKQMEKVINQLQPCESQDQNIAIAFLLQQHKNEILDDPNVEYTKVVDLTFNKEFVNMVSVCVFVPFLHEETPKPINVVKTPMKNDGEDFQAQLTERVMKLRLKIAKAQKVKSETYDGPEIQSCPINTAETQQMVNTTIDAELFDKFLAVSKNQTQFKTAQPQKRVHATERRSLPPPKQVILPWQKNPNSSFHFPEIIKTPVAQLNASTGFQKVERTRFDDNILLRHQVESKQFNEKISQILEEPALKNTTWQSLFTHPKLMNQFYWKDKNIHDKQQRIEDIKQALFQQDQAKAKRQKGIHPWVASASQRGSKLIQQIEKNGALRVLNNQITLNGQSGNLASATGEVKTDQVPQENKI